MTLYEAQKAQWTSLVLMFAVVFAELVGIFDFYLWHAIAIVCLASATIAIVLRRSLLKTAKHRLLHPYHIKEIAEAIDLLSDTSPESTAFFTSKSIPSNIHIGSTSLGIQISASILKKEVGRIYYYDFSD